MSMKEALEKLQGAIALVSKGADGEAEVEILELGPEQFIEHVTKHVTALKSDKAPTRKARAAYLNEILAIAKNYEGPTPGAMSIPQFTDPAQTQHTTTQPTVPTTQPAGSNFSQDDQTIPTPGTPSTPSAGGMPPSEAGPSGHPFADPASNFAKALEGLTAALTELAKGEETPKPKPKPAEAKPTDEKKTETAKTEGGEKPKSDAKAEGGEKPAEAKPTDEKKTPTTKAADNAWPYDMNSKVGLGKSETEEDPEFFFGWDSGSELAKEAGTGDDAAAE